MSQEKALIINYYWPPCGGAGVQRSLKFAHYLPEYGVSTRVLTVDEAYAQFPHYDESMLTEVPEWLEVDKTKAKSPYQFYKRFVGKDKVPSAGFANETNPGLIQKLARFIRGNFFIPDARIGWNAYAIKKASEIIQKHNITTIITSSPPHSTQLIGQELKKNFQLKWIANLADPWTEIYWYNELYRLPFARKKDARLEKEILEEADHIITVSHFLKDQFHQKAAMVNPEKISVIYNGYDEKSFTHIPRTQSEKEFVITYIGSMADAYKPQVFFDALKKLKKDMPGIAIKFTYAGQMSQNIENYIVECGLDNILDYRGFVSHDKVIELMMQSNLLLLVIPEFQGDKGNIPGKLFEYLRAMRPILNIGPKEGESAELIRDTKTGKTFERSDKDQIVQYVNKRYTQWSEGYDPIAEMDQSRIKQFSREQGARQLANIINNKK